CPHPRGGRHLVVSAAPRVELRCQLADLLVQQTIDQRVNVFVAGDRLLAGVQARANGIQPALDRLTFAESQYVRMVECRGPGARNLEVERPEAKIHTDRTVECIERCGRRRSKSAAPHAMGTWLRVRGGGGHHAICRARSAGASSTG